MSSDDRTSSLGWDQVVKAAATGVGGVATGAVFLGLPGALGRAVTLVFVIITRRLSWLHRDRGARFFYKLLGRLVNTNQRIVGIVRSMVDSSTSSIAATKALFALGGITHCSLRWGLRMFFLKLARSCCRWPSRQY